MKYRKIPATMVTQHPDHAAKPYWIDSAYIGTQHEAEEAYRSFAELGATEYKWDWEGKLVDESVAERLFGEHFTYFSQHPLGVKRFLTFRLPNPRIENEFRLGRAFMNMASTASAAKHFGFEAPPLFEVILPMTETADEMLALQEAFVQIHTLKHPLWKLTGQLTNLRVIPLFEQVPTIITSDTIIARYLALYRKRFKKQPPYMRPYVARSDPALNSGIVPTVLAIKIALSRYQRLAKREGLDLFPVIGAAALPFRGGLTPDRVDDFMREYQGIRTTTIQSAFRYDYPKTAAIKAIAKLETDLVKRNALQITPDEESVLLRLISASEKAYKGVIEEIAPLINSFAGFIPPRRERFQHIGLFGYSRGEKGIKLPRAITFTAVMYSLGIPPEFIGTGRAIRYAKKTGMQPLLETHYVYMKEDLLRAGRFLNKNNVKKMANSSPVWDRVLKDVEEVERYLGGELKPVTQAEKEHGVLVEQIMREQENGKQVSELITKAALARKSLG